MVQQTEKCDHKMHSIDICSVSQSLSNHLVTGSMWIVRLALACMDWQKELLVQQVI